jgi:RNA polymerase sigma-70 factor (ECF subfamily)
VAVRIPHRDEAELVARAREGDRAAFGRLVEHYAGSARRVARAVLGHPEDADDAAQDGFLNAWTRLGGFDPRRGSFGPWLLAIVVRAALDRRRRRRVRETEPLTEAVPGPERADREAERRLLRDRIREALDALPERRRLAVVLFDLEGYTHGEIAALLGAAEGTVRSDVHLARRALREALGDWKEDLP